MTSISLSATATGKADAVVVGVYATETAKGVKGVALAPGAEAVDAAYGGTLAKALDLLGAAGKDGELTRLPGQSDVKAPLIVAVGLGKKPGKGASLSTETLRKSAAAAARSLAGKAKAVFALPAEDAEQVGAIAEGVLLGSYAWQGLKTPRKDAKGALGEVVLASPAAKQAPAKKALERAATVAGAVNLARDLINTPPSHLYPQTFAERAQAEVKDAALATLSIEVLDEKALTKGGYGGIMGIGKGSAKPPRLVRVTYRHPKAKKHLALVGKGITFDTGGISLKPANAMDTMKSDMSGAAAVFSATLAVARQEVPVNVTTYLSLAENMPGGGAIKVSDVITMYGGKTVEIMNTDAEGRVVMADALARASEDGPDLLLDVATLTGAQVLALDRYSAVMGNDDDLRATIVETAKAAGEDMWPMPLPEYLRETIDTQSADISNMGQRMGGMLVAGLFLREFVGEGIKWAHLDIAGASFNEKAPYGDTPKGGTGAAVRTLVKLAEDLGAGK
ncbi:leucyl aminopeptidase [Catenulispora sp. MAP12-49]|uniref:leucyl aminopeptidase n=1 Tax=unclassified Catenulispora TaxID=414885 RepID=UPI0035154BDE